MGLIWLTYSFAEPLVRLSYDLPFLWRTTLDTHEIVLVYLDEFSARQLNQPLDDVWNRELHVRLLHKLTAEKARLVFYDISFDQPREPDADTAFAAAIRENGKVVLGAVLEINERQGVRQERILPPIRLLRKAAEGYGLLAFKPVDPDYGVRRMYFGTSLVPTATWKAAQLLGAKMTQQSREHLGSMWVNYYGPRNTFSSVGLAQAIAPNVLPPDFFNNKIVMIGGQFAVSDLMV
ncbi:MAG: CHASE2 domain-containing protein, partial [Chthoniobacterales bacterium]